MRTLLSTTILDFPTTTTSFTSATRSTSKRPKLRLSTVEKVEEDRNHQSQEQPLLPGLPDHISHICLSLVPPSILYSVCHSWRNLIYSPSFPPFLSLYVFFESTESQLQGRISYSSLQLYSFDPISCDWQQLPSPPTGLDFRLLLRHPSFISRKLPIQSVAVSGKLVLLAATADQLQPALSRPLIFDPITKHWAQGPLIPKPRRWCAAGASRATVFVVSGIGSHYNIDVGRSVDKWDLWEEQEWKWEKMRNLKDGKFSRDAIEAVGWRGKLCMVNVKGDAAKDGTIYNVLTDTWEDMPQGMLAGWRGPAAAMDEETIYVVDESKGSLKRYDHVRDLWVEVAEDEMLIGAQQIVAARGKVCVLLADGGGVVVVDVVASPARMWVVDAPPGLQGVAIHILPRSSHQEMRTK